MKILHVLTGCLSLYVHPSFMLDLVSMFDKNRELLTIRGSFIVRNLCLLLEAEKLYRAFAGSLLRRIRIT